MKQAAVLLNLCHLQFEVVMQVNTLVKKISLSLSPLEVYKRLCDKGLKEHTALLETAEAGTQAHRKSIIAISSAVEIKALNNRVTLTALNDNGIAFLQQLDTAALSDFSVKKTELCLEIVLNQLPVVTDEDERLAQSSILEVLKLVKSAIQTDNFENDESSLLLGAFSFDLVDQFEALPKINKSYDDYIFYLADQLLIQSMDNNSAQIIVKGFGQNATNDIRLGLNITQLEEFLQEELPQEEHSQAQEPKVTVANKVSVNLSDEVFETQVKQAKQHIIDGDVFQVVLSRDYQVDCPKPIVAYEKLRSSNPSPYMYFLNFGDKQLFGASPESCLKVTPQKEVSLYPIAGTRKRAFRNNVIDFERDSQVEYELIEDRKEAAEHMMLVDLARNDLARIIRNGSRKITQLKKIVKYSHVMHLVSEVKGVLKEEIDSLDAYKACSNMGTLTGAPKIKAMEIIRDYEQKSRGFYGGAVAVLNANDEFDSAIIIRSALVENNVATITAGAGVVFDSIPSEEAQETDNKAKAVLSACLSVTSDSEVAA